MAMTKEQRALFYQRMAKLAYKDSIWARFAFIELQDVFTESERNEFIMYCSDRAIIGAHRSKQAREAMGIEE